MSNFKNMETIITHPKSAEQATLFEQLAKTLKVPFEIKKEGKGEGPYNPEFVAKIKRGEKAARAGKGMKVNISDLWK